MFQQNLTLDSRMKAAAPTYNITTLKTASGQTAEWTYAHILAHYFNQIMTVNKESEIWNAMD